MVIEGGSGVDSESGYFNTLPVLFTPAASLKGYVTPIGGYVGEMRPLYNKYVYGVEKDTVHHSYCINEYTEEVTVIKWASIGPTGYIWAELDDINLNYLFDFEVIEATFTNITALEEDEEVCGGIFAVDLEVICPKKDDPDLIKRRSILPNALVLKAPKPMAFFNSDWWLEIKYKYKMLVAEKTLDCCWPGSSTMYELVPPPFSVILSSDTEFEITDIRFGTIGIMAYIIDKDGRLQAAVAAKMLLDVVTTRCRPVEISYSYKADAIAYDLIPNSGFFTWVGGDKILSGNYSHYMKALCGDHDCDPDNCKGPMWFPFNNCTTMGFYSWYSGAATCTMPVEGQPRSDWRYRMADEYKAWVRAGNDWAASCGNGWYYSYSKAGGSEFAGYGNIRTEVDLKRYEDYEWTQPPFGNDGREITERWLSQEHYSFWDLSGVEPIPRSEYMPLVFDDEMLFTSFNAFEEKGRIGPVEDCLHTTCILNNMLSAVIGETLSETRYEFKDIFNKIKHEFCMYPPPIYIATGDTTYITRYGFKDESVAWVWREYWKDIERADDDNVLNFVDFVRPNYYFDAEKTEHKLITDEGDKKIIFTAPKKDEGGDEGDIVGDDESKEEGGLPTICISNGVPRKFKILYDEYNSEQVDWVDESAEGADEFGGGATGGWESITDGTTGEEDNTGALYEKTTGDEWFHDYNTIFDENASAAKSEDRKIVLMKDSVLGDTHVWYNRGLIASIPKNRLFYLPYEEEPTISPEADPPPDNTSEFFAAWYNDSLFSKEVTFYASDAGCVTNINMDGYIGNRKADHEFKGGIYCQPDLLIAECRRGDTECSETSESVGTIIYEEAGKSGNGISSRDDTSYDYYLDLLRLPERMLFPPKLIQLRFTLFPNQYLMLHKDKVGRIIRFFASEYIDATETIKVWEQRYTTSTGDFGKKNPDGPESKTLRCCDRDEKNAGQYFPKDYGSSCDEGGDAGSSDWSGDEVCTEGSFDGDGDITGSLESGGAEETGSGAIQCKDKMTMIGAGGHYCDDVELEISKGNLKEVEKEEQKVLYCGAYDRDDYDMMLYDATHHPAIESFMRINSIDSCSITSSCLFKAEKLVFDKTLEAVSFDQSGDFWQAGGHYFKWGDSYYSTACYLMGPLETIYYPVAVHHKHGEDILPYHPGESYVGWAKLEFYEGKLDQVELLEKPIETGYSWAGIAGGFVLETST